MKWLIYLLVLLNIGFGLWHIRSQDMKAAQVKQADDQALNLILLKEYTEPVTATATQGPVSAAARCYTLGPFKSSQDAAQARTQLGKAGIEALHRVSKANTRTGYWVYIPSEQTRKAAQEHVAKLKANNVKDYFLVVTGEYANAVSLGVFSQPELAQRRTEELTSLGFNVKLQKVDLPVREYWLDWPISRALDAAILDAIRKQNSGVGQTERNCQPAS